jgi:hypothetical protein
VCCESSVCGRCLEDITHIEPKTMLLIFARRSVLTEDCQNSAISTDVSCAESIDLWKAPARLKIMPYVDVMQWIDSAMKHNAV